MDKTIADVVREYFPGASDDEVGFIVWEKTGFPAFWRIPEDGATGEECFRKQIQDFKHEVEQSSPTSK